MKYILLLRHAKSSWNDPLLDDYDRPLADRGLKAAPRVGKYLRKIGAKPDHIVSSPAKRARETVELVVDAMKLDQEMINWNEDLYFEGTDNYLEAIQQTPTKAERVLIVGHNPLLEYVATSLSGGNHSTSFRIPTAGLVCLESYAASWDNINPGTCQVKWMMIPKVLKNIID